jgi:predicted Zn-dependent protease
VEIDYMPGYEPNAEALDSLKAFFEQRLHKNSITIKEPTQIESRNQASYSANDVRNIESEERSTFSEGDTLAAYFMIVDGDYSQRDLMGIAYYNTSNAFFGPAYDEASSGPGSISRYRVEAISFRHEFGHLFGLVDIPNSGTEMQEPHRDQEHGNHCDNDQCLMYYATQTTDLIGNTVGDQEITPLDANCIADLRANGGR